MGFLILMLFAISYVAVGGYVFGRVHTLIKGDCRKCRDPRTTCFSSHQDGAFFAGVLWPIGLPFYFAKRAGSSHENRDERRRRKELADANHQKELARIRMEEDAMLTHQLESIKRRRT